MEAGGWRMPARRVGGTGVRGNAIAFARCWSLWQQTNIPEPARLPVISNMVGATDPTVAYGAN